LVMMSYLDMRAGTEIQETVILGIVSVSFHALNGR